MWRYKEINHVPVYRIMNQINLIDFGQLICHFISGFFPIFPEVIDRSRFFSSFLGSTVNSLWQAMFPYFCVLSISRILIIKKRMDPNHLSWHLKIAEIAWCWPAILICYLMYLGIIIHLLMVRF
ncbi:hypothetical protein OESDEN_07811 [Oesophagostomum dentatum]|uniref:G-protein coupled receptors family 1 profile domain-containing protein n=1 Tax=Oesophagostomum dentatum TaxID=61180 RepID=A0A0B1T4Y3_OESDE|nr:hypothetical protein OESDEN_07811 [Oesophagostomum dentatum]